jgi:hypothetical protein
MGWIGGKNGAREVEEAAGCSEAWLHHANSLTRIRRDGKTVYATKEEAERARAAEVEEGGVAVAEAGPGDGIENGAVFEAKEGVDDKMPYRGRKLTVLWVEDTHLDRPKQRVEFRTSDGQRDHCQVWWITANWKRVGSEGPAARGRKAAA